MAKHNILWVDCIGALVVGCVVIAASSVLCGWEGLPLGVVLAMGVVNLFYGAYSLFTTARNPRPLILVVILSIANMLWLPVCILIAANYWDQITFFGFLHVIGEGLYVAGLGFIEWRLRHLLMTESRAKI